MSRTHFNYMIRACQRVQTRFSFLSNTHKIGQTYMDGIGRHKRLRSDCGCCYWLLSESALLANHLQIQGIFALKVAYYHCMEKIYPTYSEWFIFRFYIGKSCGQYLTPGPCIGITLVERAEQILNSVVKTLQTTDWSERILTRIVTCMTWTSSTLKTKCVHNFCIHLIQIC